jgi:hypothetical protein
MTRTAASEFAQIAPRLAKAYAERKEELRVERMKNWRFILTRLVEDEFGRFGAAPMPVRFPDLHLVSINHNLTAYDGAYRITIELEAGWQ